MANLPSVAQVLDFLNILAPPPLAESWDNVGLQLGHPEEEVSGILVALDVTEAVLWEAVQHKANLILTHHPLFFRPISSLDDSTVAQRLIRLGAQMAVNIACFHTNLDSAAEGLNQNLAKSLGLKNIRPLLPHPQYPGAGMGRLGQTPKPTQLFQLLNKIGELFQKNCIPYVGDPHRPIRKVAVVTGSGGAYFQEAHRAQADVLVTGDVKYHHALDATAEGIALIDLGHFSGEIAMVEWMAQKLIHWLKKKSYPVDVWQTQAQTDPIRFWQASLPETPPQKGRSRKSSPTKKQ